MLEHGGNLHAAVARFGQPMAQWLDLSTGINPHAYPIPELDASVWHRLPQRHPALLHAAQAYYNTSSLLPVAGTQAAIQALPRLMAEGGRIGRRVVVAGPTYAEHAHQWAKAGHLVKEIPHDLLEEAVADAEVMVVCNPNNPTGVMVAPERLLGLAEKLAAKGGWLVVDEAFCDMTPNSSIAAWAGQAGLIVLRSIGKFFGLAGLRLGFVAAQPALLAALDDMLGPWAVSGPSQEIAANALANRPWQRAMREHLDVEGSRLHHLLGSYGIPSQGCALYQWWPEVSAASAMQLQHHMARNAIWVRLFSHHARGIRLGLPPDEIGWQRLAQALATWEVGCKSAGHEYTSDQDSGKP